MWYCCLGGFHHKAQGANTEAVKGIAGPRPEDRADSVPVVWVGHTQPSTKKNAWGQSTNSWHVGRVHAPRTPVAGSYICKSNESKEKIMVFSLGKGINFSFFELRVLDIQKRPKRALPHWEGPFLKRTHKKTEKGSSPLGRAFLNRTHKNE